ncbi:MAG TPA: succinate dehydrogenase assembly factor 2 [Sphingomicrobium sp.]|nr:succinate dehydrogenase assembly factor 2 [Sphingomicrobium sp.]
MWADSDSNAAFRKLEWRCRRGMKELDLLLLRYLRQGHGRANSEERAIFEELLELPDPELARYLIAGDVPSDPRQAALCRAVLESN